MNATVAKAPQTCEALRSSSLLGYAQAASIAIHQPVANFKKSLKSL